MNIGRLYKEIYQRAAASSFLKDSTWAVAGNCIGYALLLFAGIIIARILGKEQFGEYGMVKVTMFQIATFSTFGLSYTVTKFVAEYLTREVCRVPSIARAAVYITLSTSILLCILVVIFAEPIARYCNAPSLTMPLRVLGFLIVFRAVSYVFDGIIGGFKKYRNQGINNIVSGVFFVIISIPFSYYGGLVGALSALSLYQVFLSILNARVVLRCVREIKEDSKTNSVGMLLNFSLPVAGQELTYFMVSWLCPIFIVRYSSLGELGIYNACAQWYSVCLYMPSLLRNVTLSYLSSSSGKPLDQRKLVNRMLAVNIVFCTVLFAFVFLLSPVIVSLYGDTFVGMRSVLNVLIFSSIFQSVILVYCDNMVAEGRNWQMFLLRSFRDVLTIVLFVVVLIYYTSEHSALEFAVIQTVISVVYAILLASLYRMQHRNIILS